jgi:photosystem II stability/assembly factor-like uncharacterized protein
LINETQPGSLGGRVPTTLPQSGTIGNLFFLDELHGWLSVDQDSSDVVVEVNFLHSGLFATDDGGRSWRPVFVTNGQDRITGIAFTSPTEGYLADLDPLTQLEVVLSTRDAGATWTQIYPSSVPNNVWRFIDARHAVGAGTLLDPATILTTEDGGVTWRQVGSLRDGNDGTVIQMSFPDLLHGWVIVQYDAGNGRTYALSRTTDGGATWTTLSPGRIGLDYAAYDVSFQGARNGYVSTVDGRISVTHDGGDTFQAANTDGSRAAPVPGIRAQTGRPAMQFQVYILVPFSGPLPDHGWAQIPLTDEVDGFSIADAPQTRDRVRGCDHRQATSCQILLFVSVDGATWTRYDLSAALPLRVQFEGNAMRWMGRPAGPLYRTDDGGQSWTQVR